MISFAIAFIGFWLLATTSFVEYGNAPLLMSDLICGVIFIAIGLGFRRHHGLWKPWLIALLGLWLSFAPLLYWAPNPATYLNSTIAGVAAMAIFLILPVTPHQLPDTGPSIPPGWSFNPSSWAQRIPIIFLAFVCWMISRYLAAYQLGYISTVWDPFFDPGTVAVLTSDVSKAFPVSDAGLGALAYTIETLSGFGGERRWRTCPWLVLLFGLLTIPLSITSIILIMLQPVVVGAWCSLCLINAFLMLVPISFAIDEVAATIQFLRYSKEKPFFKLLIEGGHCPGATTDHRTPDIDRPFKDLMKATAWGVTFPWNLLLSFLLGAWLMITPALFPLARLTADADHILGALVVVVSLTTLSEVVRSYRYINIALATLILAASFATPFSMALLHQVAVAILIALLALRKGPIFESTTYTL